MSAKFEAFLEAEKTTMLHELTRYVKNAKGSILHNPEEFCDMSGEDPAIDVRLCIDPYEGRGDHKPYFTWLFRLGLSDFDPYHSEYCAGLSIGLDTKTEELLEDLLEQIKEQFYQRQEVRA